MSEGILNASLVLLDVEFHRDNPRLRRRLSVKRQEIYFSPKADAPKWKGAKISYLSVGKLCC